MFALVFFIHACVTVDDHILSLKNVLDRIRFRDLSHRKAKKKICVLTVTCQKKSRVGRSALIFLFFLTIRSIGKTGISRSRYFIFEISGKSSFVEAVL